MQFWIMFRVFILISITFYEVNDSLEKISPLFSVIILPPIYDVTFCFPIHDFFFGELSIKLNVGKNA